MARHTGGRTGGHAADQYPAAPYTGQHHTQPVPVVPSASPSPDQSPRRRRGWGLLVVPLAVVVMVGAMVTGGWLIYAGLTATTEAHPQPLPSQTFSLAPSAAAQLADPPAVTTPQKGSQQQSCSADAAGKPEVVIASLCIYAPIVPTHVEQNSLLIPESVGEVGLDTGSATLSGKAGTTIVAGHVDNRSQGDGAFYFLHQVQPGARVKVTGLDGTVTNWVVYKVSAVIKAALPSDIWQTNGEKRLVLVTCGGKLLHLATGNTYEDNVLVYATPAPAGLS